MISGAESLNYHHLRYFWFVAREGGLVAAGKVLRLSHPTLSAQIHALEEHLGVKLFNKAGRRLVLTDEGRLVYRYAEEIFALGRELTDAVAGRETGRPMRLNVGVADVVPKLIVRRLLEPALSVRKPVRLVCSEGSFEELLGDLAAHALHVVISDSPVPPGSHVRAFDHLLGETRISFFGVERLARKYRRGFPASLSGAPMLLPLETLTLRRSLDRWLGRHRIEPHVVGEFEDSALLSTFGADGLGIFAAPAVVEREVCAQYGVRVIGRAADVRQRYYAISIERRLAHPAVVALTDLARERVFRSVRG